MFAERLKAEDMIISLDIGCHENLKEDLSPFSIMNASFLKKFEDPKAIMSRAVIMGKCVKRLD